MTVAESVTVAVAVWRWIREFVEDSVVGCDYGKRPDSELQKYRLRPH